MNHRRPQPGRRTSTLALVVVGVGLLFLLMAPFSFLSYTSVGFDIEYEKGGLVIEDFYRARWPGDGSFRVGCGTMRYTPEEEDVDPVDLAARFLRPPQSGLSATSWIRFAVAGGLPEGKKGQLYSSTWLIVPSWFPGLLLVLFPLVWFWRRRGRARRPTT